MAAASFERPRFPGLRHQWVARASYFSLALVVGALFFLQVLDDEEDLFRWLCAFSIIALSALIAVFFSASRDQADGALNTYCLWASAAFFGYIVLRAVTSPSPYIARPDLYVVVASLVLYGLASRMFGTATQRSAVIVPLLAFGVVHVVFAVVQAAQGGNLSLLVPALGNISESSRASGLYANPNHLAGLLEILAVFGLSLTCWSRWPKWVKVVVAYLTGACFLGLALTGSRGGYLGVMASLLVFGVLSLLVLRSAGRPVLLKWGSIGLTLLVAAFGALWLLIDENVALSGRIEKIVTDESRLGLWQAAIEQWRLQPWIGTGSGTYLFYGRQFRAPSMQMDPVEVHNDYLHLLCEYGIVGAAGFLLFFIAHVRHGWRSFVYLGPDRIASGRSPLSDRLALTIGALSAIAASVVHSAFDYNLHIPANALLLAFVFGIVAAPGLNLRSEKSHSPTVVLPRYALGVLGAVLLIQCVRLLPGEYYAAQARATLWDEEPAAAAVLANKALRFEQHNPDVYFVLGRALFAHSIEPYLTDEKRSSLLEEALAAFDKAHRLAPLDGTFPLDKGLLLDKLGRFTEAEEMYQLAVLRDPRATHVADKYKFHLELWKQRAPNDVLDSFDRPKPRSR